jgi:hypothetical protein
MSAWLPILHDFFKEFGSVIATIFAATVAASISVRLGRNQAAIAQSQADIARDKLKFDLFEMRYSIYSSVKELIEYATAANPGAPIDSSRVRNLYVKLDEARFFFDEGVIAFINDVCAAAEAYFNLRSERAIANPDDTQKWTWLADQLAGCSKRLRDLYAAAPATFESSLRFDQVTLGSTQSRVKARAK